MINNICALHSVPGISEKNQELLIFIYHPWYGGPLYTKNYISRSVYPYMSQIWLVVGNNTNKCCNIVNINMLILPSAGYVQLHFNHVHVLLNLTLNQI